MLLWFLVAVPLVAGVTLLVTRVATTVAIATAAVTVVLSVAAAVTRPAVSVAYLDGISFGLRVDGLSAVMVVTVAVVLLAVLVFAAGEPNLGGRFYGLMLVFAAAMLVTVTATTLVALLMAWEVMGAASYALIGYWWREPRRVDSGTLAFLTTRAADVGLYLAAGAALAGGAAGLDLSRLAGLPDGWRDVVAAGLVVAALGKSAQLPFSFWLSRAMDGPSPVSALLHSATMVAAGAYLLLRMEPLLAATPWAAVLVAWAGAATAVLLGAVAVVQRDLKQLLAASTCAQVGFMVLAAGVAGTAAGTAHLVAHAVTKSLLFLCAGAWLTALGTKNLAELRGAARRHPVVGITFTAGTLALAGVPPLSLWVTKDHVLAAALHESLPLYLVGLAAAALSAAYAGRALALVWASPAPERTQVPRAQQVVLPPLAAGAVGLGVIG
ncbi:MAG TPA: proton-conducting transporter membrane subunit, partial [Euzebyales bacterium]|nr:proton-conducting transporter membrane subunit [Euzebyales bacterium]